MDFHSMKRKELQALCKKYKIPANLTNLEMANRLTSLLKGKDKLFTERRSCLKALVENGCEIESDVENKRVKKVRFSLETHMIEFEKSEAKVFKVKRRGRRKSVINSIVENVGGPELSEGVGHVTRSRGRRLVEEGVTERKGGKGSVKDDALGSNLPSSVDNVASFDVGNEESRVRTRSSLRKRELVDERKRKKEDIEKGLKKKGRERNPRQGKVKARDNVTERGESDVECSEVPAEKLLRRSKRNVTKVEDYKLISGEAAAAGNSLKPVDSAVSEGSGPSGLDIDAAMEEKKRSPVKVAMRRSRSNASGNEPLITLDDLVAVVNYERKMKKQRRDPAVEEEAILVDSITIELPLATSSRNVKRSKKAAPEIVAGNFAQKAKRKSKKQVIEIEDFSPENLTTKELPDVDVLPSLTEVAESAINKDSDNEYFIDNLKKHKKRSGKSPPKVQDSSKGINEQITASESTELDDIEPGTETTHRQTEEVGQDVKVTQEIKKNLTGQLVLKCYGDPAADCSSAIAEQFFEGSSVGGDVIYSGKLSVADSCVPIDQLDSTDPKGIQLWVELSIDMETMSRPASLDLLVEDEGISSDKSQEYIEHQGLETVRVDVLERYGNANLNGPCEREGSTLVKDKTFEVNPTNYEDANPNYNSDRSSTLSSGRALEKRDLSLSMQTNDGEVDGVAGDRNFDQEELKCTTLAKSDEHNPLEENYDASDKFYEYNVPEPFRRVTRMLEDGNVNDGEDSEEPADLKGKHLGSPSISANTLETNCTRIEYNTSISSFESSKNALEFNLTSEYPVSGTIVEGGHSVLQDNNAQKQEKSIHAMDLDKRLKPRKQSLSIEQNDVRPDDAAEAEKHFADVKISAELPKFEEEENILGKFWESNPFDSSGCKLGMLGDLDVNVGKDFVGDVDSEKLVLAAEDFASHTIDESKESHEDEPEKDEDADLIESCIREIEKVDSNFEEPTDFEVSMAAVISGTGNVIHIPTGNYIEESTTTTMKSDITLGQKAQSPFLHMYGSEADNVAEEDTAHNQVDLNSNESDQSVEDKHFEDQYHPQNMLAEYSPSDPSKRSARRMLENDISNGGGDSTMGNTTDSKAENEGSVGLVELCVREECFSAQKDDYDENPANSEDVMAAMKCRSSISPHVFVGHNYDESTNAMNLDVTLEQREQSPTVQWNGCEAGSAAEVNRNYDQVELKCEEFSKSADDRPLGEQCHSPKKYRKSSISDTSIRSARSMLQYEIDDSEDSVALQKNAAGQKKSDEAEPDKDENVGFIQSCMRDECTSAKRDDNYKENAMNSDKAMAAMKCGTANSPCVSALHNIEEATCTMNLDVSLKQRVHSPVVHRYEGLAEVDGNYGQVELKCDELSKTIEDRPFNEKYHSPGSKLHGGEDSPGCQKNSTSSRKTFADRPDKDGNIDFTDSRIIKKCVSVQITDNSEEVPVYSRNPVGADVCTSGNLSHIPLVDNNEHAGSRNSAMALDQREQSPVLQINGCHADNVAEEGRSHDQLELYSDETAESVKDRCLEEQYHLPRECLVSNVSYSSRKSASRMLHNDIVRGGEDLMKRQEKSYEVAPEDGNAGYIKSYVIDKCNTSKNYEDNPENSKDATEEISRTVNFTPTVDNKDVDYISTTNMEMALEKRKQSPPMQRNDCETDKSADLLGTRIVTTSLAAEAVERNCSAIEFSSRISNFECTDPLDFTATLDSPEFEEASGDVNKGGHSTFPDTSAQKREDIMDAMEQSSNMLSVVADDAADAFNTCKEVNNYVDLATFERGNNNAEDVVDRKFQVVVLAAQMCASNIMKASDTCAEGIHSPVSDNDAKQQGLTSGDEIFVDNGKKEDNDGICEKISDFASTEFSEAKFNLNNFQEEFSCKDREDNAKERRENLAATFSQVQFTMSEIHSEEKIVDIADDISSKLYKHHEMLKESDVTDTINEYIESESTMNPSLRIDDASDTLHIGVLTKVPEPEDKNAEETIDTTGRKFELSVERDDQVKGEATDLEETALGSAWIEIESKNSDVVADKNIFLAKQFTSEMREKNIRAILIHGTPKGLQMVADMKENLQSFNIEKIGCLTRVKPATKRPALKDVLQKI